MLQHGAVAVAMSNPVPFYLLRTDAPNMAISTNSTALFMATLAALCAQEMITTTAKNYVPFLRISEILFVISDFIFSNAASMYLRSLSMCTMAVDDLAFSVTSRMGRLCSMFSFQKR
jgi:hypothetical protein